MEIEYTLRPEDFRAFTRYHYRHINIPTPSLVIAIVGVLTIGILVSGLSITVPLAGGIFEGKGILAFWVGLAWGWIGAGLCQSWWQRWTNRATWKTNCQDKRSQWATQDIRVIISPEQMQTVSQLSANAYRWPVIWHIGVSPSHVFLYFTANSAILIPRRAFRDNAHFEEFIALAREYQQGWKEPAPKPTGIITSLPPEATAITHPNAP